MLQDIILPQCLLIPKAVSTANFAEIFPVSLCGYVGSSDVKAHVT